MYHHDLLGRFLRQGREKRQQKEFFCRVSVQSLFTSDHLDVTCETEMLPAICHEGIPCKASASDSETTITTEAMDSVEERNQSEDLEGKLLQAQQELTRLREENNNLWGSWTKKKNN